MSSLSRLLPQFFYTTSELSLSCVVVSLSLIILYIAQCSTRSSWNSRHETVYVVVLVEPGPTLLPPLGPVTLNDRQMVNQCCITVDVPREATTYYCYSNYTEKKAFFSFLQSSYATTRHCRAYYYFIVMIIFFFFVQPRDIVLLDCKEIFFSSLQSIYVTTTRTTQ